MHAHPPRAPPVSSTSPTSSTPASACRSTTACGCSSSPDLLAVGWLANRERERRHGARTYFNHNLRLEATNVCEASCLFCSFARLKQAPGRLHDVARADLRQAAAARDGQPLTEVHIVNGLHPGLPFSYYTDLLSGLKADPPGIHLKCFTAVEIAFFADHYGMTDEQVLRELMAAGLDSLPGGGAEIFAERVRRKICHDKCDARRYLAIHRIAHRLGMRTNVTMLYGHIETAEERVDHMLRPRALQDETGGFQAFIPLAFHPDNNQMRKLPAPTATDTLRVHAVARLMLDNVDHIKAYWIATRRRGGADRALVRRRRSRRHGAGRDDLPHGRLADAAGAVDARIEQLIRDAGREPIERDTLYNVVRAGASAAVLANLIRLSSTGGGALRLRAVQAFRAPARHRRSLGEGVHPRRELTPTPRFGILLVLSSAWPQAHPPAYLPHPALPAPPGLSELITDVVPGTAS